MQRNLDLTGKFTMETRQAMFSAVTDAVHHNESHARSIYVAANLIRTSTLGALMASSNVRIDKVLRDLQADAPGESVFDAFQALIRGSATLPDDPEAEHTERSHPAINKVPRERFVALPLSRELSSAYQALSEKFADAPEESVSPTPVLIALLESDSQLLTIFEQNGLTLSILRSAA